MSRAASSSSVTSSSGQEARRSSSFFAFGIMTYITIWWASAQPKNQASPPPRRKQPARPEGEHQRHHQVDQHRADGRADGARGRRPDAEAQKIDQERAAERI